MRAGEAERGESMFLPLTCDLTGVGLASGYSILQ